MPKLKKKHRWGAFLRLYGPRGKHTGAVLLMHSVDSDTPEAFYEELNLEHNLRRNHHAGMKVQLYVKAFQ